MSRRSIASRGPHSEIASLAWFSPHQSFAGVLAPAVADSVVPALAADALI